MENHTLNIISRRLVALAGAIYFAAGMQSCIKDDIDPYPVVEPGEATVSIAIRLPGNALAKSRALDLAEESEIRTIDLLVFEPDGGYIYSAYGRDITSLSSITKTFTATLKTGTYDIMFLTNCRELLRSFFPAGIPDDASVEQIREAMLISNTGKWCADSSNPAYSRMPMWGEIKNVDIKHDTDLTGSKRIKLNRMLARIDVVIDDAAKDDFKLTDVYIANWNSKGFVIPDTDPLIWDVTEQKVIAPTLDDSWSFETSFLHYTGSEITTTDVACVGEIYVFETPAGSEAGHPDNTCMIIGGIFEGVKYYYRIEFLNKSEQGLRYLSLLRNHLYEVRVTSITGAGYLSLSDAYDNPAINTLSSGITVYDEHDLGAFVFDGQYYMGIGVREMEFWRDAQPGLQVDVITDHEDSWTFEVTDSPDPGGDPVTWLTVDNVIDNGPDVTGSIEFSLDFNGTDTLRKAYIHFYADKLTQVLEIRHQPYYVDGYSMYPNGEIFSGGEMRRLTLTGNYPQLSARIYNAYHDITSVSGYLPATLTTSSVDMKVPELWCRDFATILFQYYHPIEREWIVIGRDEQFGYHMKIEIENYTIGDEIPAAGETYKIKVEGDNYPGFQVYPTLTYVNGLRTGDWNKPDFYSYISNGRSDIAVKFEAGNMPEEKEITIPANTTGAPLTLSMRFYFTTATQYQYVENITSPNTGQILIGTAEQISTTSLEFPSGYFLSQRSMGKMTWAEAMGIDPSYNTTTHPGGYDQGTLSGCGTYSEPGDEGKRWYVPSWEDAKLIAASFPQRVTDNSWHDNSSTSGALCWMNTQHTDPGKAYAPYHYIYVDWMMSEEYIYQGSYDKTGLYEVRCVREP